MKRLHPSLLLSIVVWTTVACVQVRPASSQATANGTYSLRRAEILAIENSKQLAPVVQAYNGDPVDTTIVDELLLDLDQDRDSAFRIIILVRVHELTNDEAVKATIFDVLKTIPFWLSPGEETRVYWTENQMSMWMSSALLLKQQYPDDANLDVGETLRQRLVHFLTLKLEYGFSEFFSSVYLPYTLCGLLNLVDFCQDEEIQVLAEQVTLKLIDHILLGSNSEGAFFAASGRNFVDYYLGSLTQIADTLWLLTGAGTKPTRIRTSTGFLATSNLTMSTPVVEDVAEEAATYASGSTMRLPIRPSLRESFEINGDLERADRVTFQWAMGAYFHPDVAGDTLWLLDEYDLWGHGEFGDYSALSCLPSVLGETGSNLLRAVTSSSVLTGADVVLYKNQGLVLSSVQDFHQGKLGYQMYPWMATTGSLAVWTQTGQVVEDWSDRPSFLSNTHLPYLEQVDNVLLIMYDPADDLNLIDQALPDSPFSAEDRSVALRWPGNEFTSQAEFGNWMCGEETLLSGSSGYVCISRPCLDPSESGIPVCTDEHQMWAVIVGNDQMYGGFDEFTRRVEEEAVVKTEWRDTGDWWCLWCGQVFYGEVQFDGIVISHELVED